MARELLSNQLHDALRNYTIEYDGDRLRCLQCDTRWPTKATEEHAHGCLAAPRSPDRFEANVTIQTRYNPVYFYIGGTRLTDNVWTVFWEAVGDVEGQTSGLLAVAADDLGLPEGAAGIAYRLAQAKIRELAETDLENLRVSGNLAAKGGWWDFVGLQIENGTVHLIGRKDGLTYTADTGFAEISNVSVHEEKGRACAYYKGTVIAVIEEVP